MILKAEKILLSDSENNILILRRPGDSKYNPAVQTIMPKDVIDYIIKLVETDQKWRNKK
tara:strand:+ start:2001 stop:2177 length:177 start_codon:yes stop_codon:yes gene_type:complete